MFQLVDGSFVRIDLEVTVPLQILCNTRASVYYAAPTNNALKLDGVAQHFLRRKRLVMTDGDASTALAMRGAEKAGGVVNLGVKMQHSQGKQVHHSGHGANGAPRREYGLLAIIDPKC